MLRYQKQIIFLSFVCLLIAMLAVIKYYINIRFYKSMESQFRRDIDETLNLGDNVVLCRVIKRRIVQHKDNPFLLGGFVDLEVILSVNDDFICGTILRSFSNSDEPYRESVESVLRPIDTNLLCFVRTDPANLMIETRSSEPPNEDELYYNCKVYLTECVMTIFSCSYESPEYEMAIRIFDEYRKKSTSN